MTSLTQTLLTGTGFWNPFAWLLGLAVALVIAYLILTRGEAGWKRGTPQTEAFLSGNPEPPAEALHLRGGNLYWGYLEALKGYYNRIVPLHTGDLNDYVLWYLSVMVVILVMVVIFA
jgi:hypothetical protein